MKIYKKIVIDIATNKIIEEDSYEYEGPLALCGGGGGGDGGDGDAGTGGYGFGSEGVGDYGDVGGVGGYGFGSEGLAGYGQDPGEDFGGTFDMPGGLYGTQDVTVTAAPAAAPAGPSAADLAAAAEAQAQAEAEAAAQEEADAQALAEAYSETATAEWGDFTSGYAQGVGPSTGYGATGPASEAGFFDTAKGIATHPITGLAQMMLGIATGQPLGVFTGALTLAGVNLGDLSFADVGEGPGSALDAFGGDYGGGMEDGRSLIQEPKAKPKVEPRKLEEVPLAPPLSFIEEEIQQAAPRADEAEELAEGRVRLRARQRVGHIQMRKAEQKELFDPVVFAPTLF